MPDRLHVLLNAEADRRVAGEAVPSVSVAFGAREGELAVSSVRVRQMPEPSGSRLHTIGPLLAAAAAVVAVVLLAAQLRPSPAVTVPADHPTAAVHSEPELGTMPIPIVIRRMAEAANKQALRFGRSTHVVPERVDVLARLQLLRGVTYLLGLAGSGTTCVFQTPTAGDGSHRAGSAGCGGGGKRLGPTGSGVLRLGDTGVTGPDGTLENVVSLQAPAYAARIRLTAGGTPEVRAPAYAGGSRWDGATFALELWSGGEDTSAVALRADGTTIDTARLAPKPAASPAADARGVEPFLGTIATPEQVRRFANGPARNHSPAVPDRVDVLAREEVEPGVTAWLIGYTDGRQQCTINYLVESPPTGTERGGGGACGPAGRDSPVVATPGSWE